MLARKLIRSLSNDMTCSENGLLYKMRAENLSEDIIERLFGDLIIAAGDTVHENTILLLLVSVFPNFL